MSIVLGHKAPNFEVSEWIQGAPTNIDQESDKIVLLEVFQVNCPGCFMHAIPEAIRMYKKYADQGVRVLGIATAFEDFDKNTLENLKLLVSEGRVIGETRDALATYGQLQDGDKLSYQIPFPLGMDKLIKIDGNAGNEQVMQFIHSQIPDFDSQPDDYKDGVIARVRDYMRSKEYSAATFEKFALKGTPSAIIVDRKGVLRDVSFGQSNHIEPMIQKLLSED